MITWTINAVISAVLFVVALVLFWALWSAWGPAALLVNLVIALIALKLVGWLGIKVDINIWSILICLVFGVPGLLVLIFLRVTGIAFKPKDSK